MQNDIYIYIHHADIYIYIIHTYIFSKWYRMYIRFIVNYIYRYIVHVGMHMSEAVMVISAGMIPVDLAKSAQERLLLLQYQHITRQP